MGKPIGSKGKYPFGPKGIRVCSANNGSNVAGDKYIVKQGSDSQFKIVVDSVGVRAIDTITVVGTATEAGTLSILVGDVSFDATIADTSTETQAAALIVTAATDAGLFAENTAGVVSITHNSIGAADLTEVFGTIAGLTFTPANDTAGVDATVPGTLVQNANALGKQQTLFTIIGEGIDIADDDDTIGTALASGEMAVRVYDAAGDVVGFAEKFSLNKVVINTPLSGTGATDGTIVSGSYQLVGLSAPNTPIIPDAATETYFVEGRTFGEIDTL